MTSQTDAVAAMTGKLGRLAALDDADRRAIAGLPFTIQFAPAAHYLVREGSEAVNCCLLVNGYAFRHKLAQDGGRQIVSFHMRGDILDLQHLLFSVADHNVQTMTEATVAWTPCRALQELAHERPRIADALWRDTLIDASIFREWVLNVGRRDARTRIAHMLCEFAARAQAAGLGAADRFELPMTQEQIGDATGLTAVHVNRMLMQLGAEGLIARRGKEVIVGDWARLRRVAGFDAAYLHAAA